MTTTASPALPDGITPSPELLHALLLLSPAAVGILRPSYAVDEETITDFTWVYLNPTGQRLLGQPECPAYSLRTLFPVVQQDDIVDICYQTLATRQPRHSQTPYQADGGDGYFLLVAQCYGEMVVVNFTDTTDQARTTIANQVRARQREQDLNRELSVANEELRTANEALEEAQRQLQQAAHQLESRITERTEQLHFSLAQAEQQHDQLQLLNEELSVLNEELTVSNEELNESNAQLARSNTDLNTFVYLASHDLKSPIANIEGLLHALHASLPPAALVDEEVSQIWGLMQLEVDRFRATIHQLTEVSQQQQAQQLPAEQVQLAPLIEAVRLDLLPLLTAAQAQLTVAVGLEMYAVLASKNLRSILYNLLSNAVKYCQPGRVPIISLRVAYAGDTTVLEVQDNGLGLTEDQQKRVFGLFQRLHTHVEGTGVGLYLVKRIVENARGTITVRSRVGVGTTFTVTLRR